MTRDEILNMPAGREMDALVAEFVMEWLPNPGPAKISPIRGFFRQGKKHLEWMSMEDVDSMSPEDKIVPHFSTDIAAAWLVVEKITDPHQMTQEMMQNMVNTKFGYWWDQANLWAMTALEAAEAICRVALLAVIGREVAE